MAAVFLGPTKSSADPWAAPGDVALRHDISVLADRGILRGPITSWPLSWPDIARDVLGRQLDASTDRATRAALIRVQRAARRMTRIGEVEWHARSAVAEEPTPLRTFADEPREEGELGLGASWTGERFGVRLQALGVVDPDDDREIRLDGSYAGVNIGNFMVSAGAMERWWGPGWEGSLILSNSARPIPSITVERNYSDAFDVPVLRWFGPWRASIVLGQLEGSRADFPDARFLGMRVSFKPLQQLEIGLSRTAQWCGEGRPCNFRTFGDLLTGRDNDQALGEQPGNQLAGYDARWAFKSIPVAAYGQLIGEDEAGGLPSKFLGLAGMEVWGSSPLGEWRLHAEYADTSCSFSHAEPEFNCAYESSIYTQGYRYRGRSIGHAMDGDGRMYSAGAVLITDLDDEWHVLARRVELNRDSMTPDSRHTLAPVAAEVTNIELSHTRSVPVGRLRVGVGYDDYKARLDGGDDSTLRGFVQLMRPF